MADLITVKSGREDNRVAMFEQDARHPDGEAFVAGNTRAVKVARTALVARKLKSGELVEVGAAAAVKTQTPPAPPVPPKLSEPWEGYDALKAEDIVARLPELDDAGRASVLAYEQSKGTRARKSIIDALA